MRVSGSLLREIAKTEISPFYLARQNQPIIYTLSVSKGKIKLLVSFDEQEVITWTEARSPDSHRHCMPCLMFTLQVCLQGDISLGDADLTGVLFSL